MSKRFVLFDFDGVIADSFAPAFDTAKLYCNTKTPESYRAQFAEANIYDSDAKHDLISGDHTNCKHDIDWWGTFVPLFEKKGVLFEGMDHAVQQLAKEYTMVIVSSSVRRAISGFLDRHHLSECFDDIYDSDVDRSKSKKIGMIFEKYGITAENCVMITDSKGDIMEAREKGVECIGVTWGFNDYNVLLSGEPWRIVRLPDELPNAVTEFFHGKHV